MANRKAQFETQDLLGSTIHYSGTVGTTPTALPSSPDKVISEFLVENDSLNVPVTKVLEVSCDGGVTYYPLKVGECIGWTPKGKIRQLYIKGSLSSVAYSANINYEDI